MRLLDNKGRLFGVINLFDLLVIIFLISVSVLALKWAKVAQDPSWVKVRIINKNLLGTMDLPYFAAELVKEGDTVVNDAGIAMATVTKVLSVEPVKAATYLSKDGEKIFFNPEESRITLMLNMKMYEKKGETYSCLTNVPVRVGDKVFLTTNKYSGYVLVRSILDGGTVDEVR